MRKRRTTFVNRPVIRILLIWIIETVGLLIMARLQDGLQIETRAVALAAVAVIGLLNALLWPILSRILLPFAVFTAGLFFLVLNGFIVWLAGQILPGFTVESVGTAIITSLGITAVNVIFSTLLTIDDNASYFRNVVRRRMRRQGQVVETNGPGVFFLEIDGLAKPVLEKAMGHGFVPTMKRWLEDEVSRLEKERSDGNELLADNGASRVYLLSGDAPHVMNTASVIKDFSRFHTKEFSAYFASPYNLSHTLHLFFGNIVLERYRYRQDRRKNVQPRLDSHQHNFKYALVRGITTTIMRELNVYTLIGDIYSGTPSAYATFVGYDEVGAETIYRQLKSWLNQFAYMGNGLSNQVLSHG